MPRRREDVAILKAAIVQIRNIHDILPGGYNSIQDILNRAKAETRRQLGQLLADLELENND